MVLSRGPAGSLKSNELKGKQPPNKERGVSHLNAPMQAYERRLLSHLDFISHECCAGKADDSVSGTMKFHGVNL